MRLVREVRCFPASGGSDAGSTNSWAGSSATGWIGPFWVVRAALEGTIDEQTGYICGISEIDSLIRDHVVPPLHKRLGHGPTTPAALGRALLDVFPSAAARCPQPGSLVSITLGVSPFLHLSVTSGENSMVRLTQSFEFSASHRLYCESLSEEQNRRVFGKCANPNGHGHNYVLEVTICGTPDERSGTLKDLPQFERIVKECVIDRFDHKCLNLDCAEFRSLNPSVENIARIIWQRLTGALEPSTLASVRVWETPKTCAECTGPE